MAPVTLGTISQYIRGAVSRSSRRYPHTAPSDPGHTAAVLVAVMLNSTILFLYGWLLEGACGATLGKAFGLPNSKVFGEHARLNLEMNAYNVLNKVNLTGLNTTISTDGRTSNPLFGQAQNAFSGRIVELQARLSF